ncbi:MAG TPA: FG-GAP repeat protein [Burkholderiaceae bacterium]|nr:FG-GAP repeat protein [Burkholderiaceae bacterium]
MLTNGLDCRETVADDTVAGEDQDLLDDPAGSEEQTAEDATDEATDLHGPIALHGRVTPSPPHYGADGIVELRGAPEYPFNRFGTATVFSRDGRTLAISAPVSRSIPTRARSKTRVAATTAQSTSSAVATMDRGSGKRFCAHPPVRMTSSGCAWQSAATATRTLRPHLTTAARMRVLAAIHATAARAKRRCVRFRAHARGWRLHTFIKASKPQQGAFFGGALGLGDDGRWLAVSAVNEASPACLRREREQPGACPVGEGAAYVFQRNPADAWRQQAHLRASNAGSGDGFGLSLSLSASGRTLAVGAPTEGRPERQGEHSMGAVYVFEHDPRDAWRQTAYLKPDRKRGESAFDLSVPERRRHHAGSGSAVRECAIAQHIDRSL